MKKIVAFFGICIIIICCYCSRTIGVNRSSPPSQFKRISSVEKIRRANIIKTNGTIIDARNIRISRDSTTWMNPKTWDKEIMPTSGIKRLYFRKRSFLEKLFLGDTPKPKMWNLQFVNGRNIDVYNLIIEKDSTFWFLAATNEKQMCPTFEIDRVVVKTKRGRIAGGVIGLVIGGVGGYLISSHNRPDSDWAGLYDVFLAPVIIMAPALGAGHIGAEIGDANSSDTYIFYDDSSKTNTSAF